MQLSSSSAGLSNGEFAIAAGIASRVHTYNIADDLSRALIVFNFSGIEANGPAEFVSEVTWEKDREFPGVIVTSWDGDSVLTAVRDVEVTPDRKGRADKVRLRFNLHFLVEGLPKRSWRTYIARMSGERVANAVLFEPDRSMVVFEVGQQAGDLGPSGAL
jgi:hypothetical protein